MVHTSVVHILYNCSKSDIANNESCYKRTICTVKKTNHMQTHGKTKHAHLFPWWKKRLKHTKNILGNGYSKYLYRQKNQNQKRNICFPAFSLIQLPSYMIHYQVPSEQHLIYFCCISQHPGREFFSRVFLRSTVHRTHGWP